MNNEDAPVLLQNTLNNVTRPGGEFIGDKEAGGQAQQTPTAGEQAAPMAKISVRNLNFFYGKHHALQDISLDIPMKAVTFFSGMSRLISCRAWCLP